MMNTQKTFNRLFARLQLQAKLKEIADQYGEAEMLIILQQALSQQFKYQDYQDAKKHDKNTG